jgi:hypothetical protein
MRTGAATLRKHGGLFVLLAFLTSLLPAAAQATVSAVPNERLTVQLAQSLALEIIAEVTAPEASEGPIREADRFSDDGDAVPPLLGPVAGSPRFPSAHFLPPATAPPAFAADSYQARAPPVR